MTEIQKFIIVVASLLALLIFAASIRKLVAICKARRWMSVALSLYTLSCTLLITWEQGWLVENIDRIWLSLGRKLPPLN